MAYKDHIRRVLRYYYWGVVILLLLLLLSSWLLGIYLDGVQGLLTPRGIRWMCSNIVPNFASVHWAKILLGVMAVGVLNESGIFRTLRGHISLKQQRALLITGGVVVFVLSLFSLLLFLPNAVLFSAFGTFSHSAFSKGFYGLVMGLAILNRLRTSEPAAEKPPDVQPPAPVIGMDGKTEDGAVPYQILRDKLEFLR